MFRACKLFALALAVLIVGASASQALGDSMKVRKPALPANLIKVPLTRQATDYTCGVSALQSVLGYYGDEFREEALAKAMKSNEEEGTAYKEIENFAKSKGYTVTVRTNMTIGDLKKTIDQGKPVICLIQAWSEKPVKDYTVDWEDGHYVVAIGHDQDHIYFMDPSTLGNYTYIPEKEFLTRWHDTDSKVKLVHFGMVVEKPKPAFNADEVKKLD